MAQSRALATSPIVEVAASSALTAEAAAADAAGYPGPAAQHRYHPD